MSRYIDADALMRYGAENQIVYSEDIDSAPSIDIVRCKECKYAHLTYDGDCKYCDIWFPDESVYLSGDDYCSFGERKESE